MIIGLGQNIVITPNHLKVALTDGNTHSDLTVDLSIFLLNMHLKNFKDF